MKHITKFTIISLSFISCCNLLAQTTIKGNGDIQNEIREVGEFEELKVYGPFDVTLVRGSEGHLKITADENIIPQIVTEVEGNYLKISFKKNTQLRNFKKLNITLSIEDISKLYLIGSGDIIQSFKLKRENFLAEIIGSGDLKIPLEVNNLDLSITGSGDIEVFGLAHSFKAEITGSGDIYAYKLESRKANVKISGSGNIRLNPIYKLKAEISGSGDVHYKGTPDKIDVQVSGSGRVTKSN